jgi:hypothetical protein
VSTARLAALTAPWIAVLIGVPAADEDNRHELTMRAGPFDQVIDETVDELDDGDVLAILVTEGERGERGTVRQCRLLTDGVTDCHNSFPILFDDDGRATFQYQLRDRGRCGADATCVVAASTGDETAMAFTVFGEPAPPPPDVRLSPAGPVAPGSTLHVDATGLPPGAPVQAAFCDDTCDRAERAAAGPDGTARFDVDVGGPCSACAIVVVGGAAVSRTPVRFEAAPSARYDEWRLVAGLAAAAAFLLGAWWLITNVDWRPPSEAATPELDL